MADIIQFDRFREQRAAKAANQNDETQFALTPVYRFALVPVIVPWGPFCFSPFWITTVVEMPASVASGLHTA